MNIRPINHNILSPLHKPRKGKMKAPKMLGGRSYTQFARGDSAEKGESSSAISIPEEAVTSLLFAQISEESLKALKATSTHLKVVNYTEEEKAEEIRNKILNDPQFQKLVNGQEILELTQNENKSWTAITPRGKITIDVRNKACEWDGFVGPQEYGFSYEVMVETLSPEAQEAREREAILNDPLFITLLDGEPLISLKKVGEDWIARTPTWQMTFEVIYEYGEDILGPQKFEIVLFSADYDWVHDSSIDIYNIFYELVDCGIIEKDETICHIFREEDGWYVETPTKSIYVTDLDGPDIHFDVNEIENNSYRTVSTNDIREIIALIKEPAFKILMGEEEIDGIHQISNNYIVFAGDKCIPVEVVREGDLVQFVYKKVPDYLSDRESEGELDLQYFVDMMAIISNPELKRMTEGQQFFDLRPTETGYRAIFEHQIYEIQFINQDCGHRHMDIQLIFG